MGETSSNGKAGPSGLWPPVTRDNPCEKCKGTDWCCRSPDRAFLRCYRSNNADGSGKVKTDSAQQTYTLYRLDGRNGSEAWPEPKHTHAEANGERADPDTLNRIYGAFLTELRISQEHGKALRARGLTGSLRGAGYRTLGKDRAKACGKLVGRGFENDLPRVPGFYVQEKDGKRFWSVAGWGGLLIPVRDARGRIVALSVRLDDPGPGEKKYRWVSSRAKGGVGPGAPVHVPIFQGDKERVRVTEGALKADVATALSKVLTIGLPGVGAYKKAAAVLRELGAKVAVVSYDADACCKRHVAEALSRLVRHLRRHGFKVQMEMWDKEDGKGIDDLLNAKKQPDLIDGDEPVDSVVGCILAEARKADPPPSAAGPPPGQVNEADDDPHRLARLYHDGQRVNEESALYYWREEYHRWDRAAYRVVHGKEIRSELTGRIKREFDRLNLRDLAEYQRRREAAEGDGEGGGRNQGPPEARKVTTKLLGDALQALNHLALLPGSAESPAWLGGDEPFPAAEVLACRNGLVHLPSLVEGRDPYMVPPTPRFFSPNALDYDFAAEAPRPDAWLEFLGKLWPDDEQARTALQEWFGYSLLPDTSQQKILFVVGPKRSGKGTIARVLRQLVGIDNTTSPTLAGLATNFGLWPLLGKSLAIISDARLSGRTDTAVVVERLLSISGEDAQTIDRKHMTPVTAKLPVRFVMMTNELPRLIDPSGALVGRLVVLPMVRTWYGKEDTRLTDKLLAELPGILLWAIAGWQRLRDRGHFEPPESGRKLVRDMEDLASPVGVFLRECCEVGPGFTAPVQDVWTRWACWCEAQGNEKGRGTRQTLGRDLRAVLPGLDTRQAREGDERNRVYVGLRLLPWDEDVDGKKSPFKQEAGF
jgi:putative DNA primase/helicase